MDFREAIRKSVKFRVRTLFMYSVRRPRGDESEM